MDPKFAQLTTKDARLLAIGGSRNIWKKTSSARETPSGSVHETSTNTGPVGNFPTGVGRKSPGRSLVGRGQSDHELMAIRSLPHRPGEERWTSVRENPKLLGNFKCNQENVVQRFFQQIQWPLLVNSVGAQALISWFALRSLKLQFQEE